MNEVRLTIQMPPSINRTYAAGKSKSGKSVFYKNQTVKQWEAATLWDIKMQRIQTLPPGRYSAHYVMRFNRKGTDICNREKMVSDILVKAGIIPDDKYIDRMLIERGAPHPSQIVDIVISLIN